MGLDAELCYRALRTRDARFDGRFFTAVRSTGVYCRPVCPAPTPRRENCLFLPCAAAAREAGYRPCLRCRPEAAPGTPAWLGTSATVARALRLIGDGALDRGGVEDLAARLGIGDRHLRRLFLAHLGASPRAVAHTRRLLFAKQLIDETTLPMTQVAGAAGFSSIRRFNAAVREAWGRSPCALRRDSRHPAPRSAGSEIELQLAYRPPLDWQGLVAFLAPRATPGVERVEGSRYRRSFCLEGVHGAVEVAPARRGHRLRARIRLEAPLALIRVAERLRRLFDLGADPAAIADQLGRDRRLGGHLARHPGVRVPGAWDPFEAAVRAVLGQQVSVRAATALAGRLVRAYGEPLRGGAEPLLRVFPTPAALRRADARRLGLPRARAAALRALARAVDDGRLVLDGSRPVEDTLETLASLPGIGPWTAQLVALRALADPDAFPAGDLGLRRALGAGGRPATPGRAEARSQAWRPWRAYAAMLLWTPPR